MDCVMPTTLFSDNDSGTMADLLKAVGLAEVAQAWLLRSAGSAEHITLRDCGGYYQIELPAALEMEHAVGIEPFAAGRGKMLVSAKQVEKAAKSGLHLDGFDYDGERARSAAYFEQRKKLSAADQKKFAQQPQAEEFAGLLALTPHPDLSLYVCVNQFRIAETYNILCAQWLGNEHHPFAENLRLLLAIFGQHPNRVEAASQVWKATNKATNAGDDGSTTLLQIVNPASGKGGNAAKANGLSIGNISGFWLSEYLKLVGFFTIATPITIKGVKDRKTYVLRPRLVELDALRKLMADFRETFYASSAIKSDILAALRFTQTFVKYCGDAIRDGTATDPFFAMFGQKGPTVTDIAEGFDVAFYKDMGSAFATMNLATINLPNWLRPVKTAEDAQADDALLDEHMAVVRSLQSSKGEEGSEEITLLKRYRDFLSGHDVERFFEFAAHFGDYCLAHRHRNQRVGQFTTEGMETLMAQDKKLTPILENSGFREVAEAIRLATVTGQYLATRDGGSYPYEVRYGLVQEFLRAAAYPYDFSKALHRFAASYNTEVARIEERSKKKEPPEKSRYYRPSIQDSSIADVLKLVDEYEDSELICTMLVGYGTARDSKVKHRQDDAASKGNEESEEE
jgi:hypothetical protein